MLKPLLTNRITIANSSLNLTEVKGPNAINQSMLINYVKKCCKQTIVLTQAYSCHVFITTKHNHILQHPRSITKKKLNFLFIPLLINHGVEDNVDGLESAPIRPK